MFLDYLITKGVFACHCQINSKSIVAGLVILNKFKGGAVTLVNRDKDLRFNVILNESQDGMYTDITMELLKS